MKNIRLGILTTLTLAMLASAVAQQASKHVLSSDEVKKAAPAEYCLPAKRHRYRRATPSDSNSPTAR